jgi:hypothetical protein
MISLCPGCHAKVGRTKAVLSQMPALLLELWREQHQAQRNAQFYGVFLSVSIWAYQRRVGNAMVCVTPSVPEPRL